MKQKTTLRPIDVFITYNQMAQASSVIKGKLDTLQNNSREVSLEADLKEIVRNAQAIIKYSNRLLEGAIDNED